MWFPADSELVLLPAERTRQRYFAAHPIIAAINLVAEALTDTLGPMMWAALIVMFLWAELFAA